MKRVRCTGCGVEIMKQHEKYEDIWLRSDGRGHAQLPGGKCPRCGQEYDLVAGVGCRVDETLRAPAEPLPFVVGRGGEAEDILDDLSDGDRAMMEAARALTPEEVQKKRKDARVSALVAIKDKIRLLREVSGMSLVEEACTALTLSKGAWHKFLREPEVGLEGERIVRLEDWLARMEVQYEKELDAARQKPAGA